PKFLEFRKLSLECADDRAGGHKLGRLAYIESGCLENFRRPGAACGAEELRVRGQRELRSGTRSQAAKYVFGQIQPASTCWKASLAIGNQLIQRIEAQ